MHEQRNGNVITGPWPRSTVAADGEPMEVTLWRALTSYFNRLASDGQRHQLSASSHGALSRCLQREAQREAALAGSPPDLLGQLSSATSRVAMRGQEGRLPDSAVEARRRRMDGGTSLSGQHELGGGTFLALSRADVVTAEELARCTQRQVLAMHGIGRHRLEVLQNWLAERGLALRSEGGE